MGNYGSADVGFFIIGGYDLLGVTTDLEDSIERISEETTTLGDSFQEHGLVGVQKASVKQNGFYDDAANSANAALVGLSGTNRVLLWNIEGNTVGKRFTGSAGALQAKYTRQLSRNALHKANAEHAISGSVEEGQVVATHAARTTDGDSEAAAADAADIAESRVIVSSSVANPTVITTEAAHGLASGDIILITGHASVTPDINGGDGYEVTVVSDTTFTIPVNVSDGGTGGTFQKVSGVGGAAYLAVTALTLDGATDLTVTIRHSPDDSTYADLTTMTAVTAAPAAQRKAIAGQIDRYVAAAWAYTGGAGGGSSATFVAGIVRS